VAPPAEVQGRATEALTVGLIYGVTVNVADLVTPRVAEIDTLLLKNVTVLVVTVKVAVVAPAATVTLEGTVATLVLLLLRVTTAPPVGAGPLMVTVPVEGLPPFTVVGLSVRVDTLGVFTVRVAVRLLLL
jgi:hypothetical protein